MTDRHLYLTTVRALHAEMDAQEGNRVVRVNLTDSLRLDDQETLLENRADAFYQQGVALLGGIKHPRVELALEFLRRSQDMRDRAEALDQQQRQKEELALQQADLVTRLLRTANGLLDAALTGWRALLGIGRKREAVS